jgi:hypothetical protein
MTIVQLALFHTQHGETIEMVEMDDELLKPEAEILDPDSLTLRKLKGGGVFTLIPPDKDYRIASLSRVQEVHHRVTKEGCPLASTWMGRMDEILMAVDLLFKPVKFKLVECAQDLQNLISPPDDVEWEPKVVEHNVLGELLGMVDASLTEEPEPNE